MDKLEEAAALYPVPKIRVLRAALDAEVPRMIDRERKRQRRKDKSQDS